MYKNVQQLLLWAVHAAGIGVSDSLVVGVSGGVDSTVLLYALAQIHSRQNIHAVHIHHGLRPEADEDAECVGVFCNQLGIAHTVERHDIAVLAQKTGKTLEAMGREVRYDAFERARRLHWARYILTAHHLGDRAESLLLNIVRWARLSGLLGLRPATKTLLRPLATLAKSDIIAYAHLQGLSWREDSSNLDTTFLRNRLRHEVIPALQTINPHIESALVGLSDYISDLKGFIDSHFSSLVVDGVFASTSVASLPPFLQREFVRYFFEQITGGTIGLSDGNLEEMLRYILTAEGGTYKIIPPIHLTKKHGKITGRLISPDELALFL